MNNMYIIYIYIFRYTTLYNAICFLKGFYDFWRIVVMLVMMLLIMTVVVMILMMKHMFSSKASFCVFLFPLYFWINKECDAPLHCTSTHLRIGNWQVPWVENIDCNTFSEVIACVSCLDQNANCLCYKARKAWRGVASVIAASQASPVLVREMVGHWGNVANCRNWAMKSFLETISRSFLDATPDLLMVCLSRTRGIAGGSLPSAGVQGGHKGGSWWVIKMTTKETTAMGSQSQGFLWNCGQQ